MFPSGWTSSLFVTLDPGVLVLPAVALLRPLDVQLLVAELVSRRCLWRRQCGTVRTQRTSPQQHSTAAEGGDKSLTLPPQVFALSVFGFTPAVEAAPLQRRHAPSHIIYRAEVEDLRAPKE